MSRKFLIFFIKFLMVSMVLSFCYSIKFLHKDPHQLLINFTCATAKDELEKHPEMQTIAMVELENNFPSDFSPKVLKCLPPDVAKIIINPYDQRYENSTMLPKETLVIYVAANVDLVEKYFFRLFNFEDNFKVISHLSKQIIVASDESKDEEDFMQVLNLVQIYEQDQKVIAKSFDMTRNLTNFESFETSKLENLSQILFPDKTKNLNGQEIYIVWDENFEGVYPSIASEIPNNLWIPYLDIIAEKMNATLTFIEIDINLTIDESSKERINLMNAHRLDFLLNNVGDGSDLESYKYEDWCFLAPVPKPYDITDLILFLPMDKSCWMWLGITIAVSTLIWRISEGHWSFLFGFFSYFMGQGQLVVRIKTNRLTMKILLQLLIFAIFIFSNGYQSLVTSFMLDPLQVPYLKTIDEVFESDLKIQKYSSLDFLHGDNPKYQKAKEDGRVIDFEFVTYWPRSMFKMNLADIQRCKMNRMVIEHEGNGKSWFDLYVVEEVVYTFPEKLFIRPFHPYLNNFQELMDRSLEAGLHQAWERFFWEIWIESSDDKKDPEEESDILDFGMIAPSLYILAFGLPFGFVALLCEIFWKDFVMELTKEYFKRKWKEIFGRKPKSKKRIQVKYGRRTRNSI